MTARDNVEAALRTVIDPELDEDVVSLGFVDAIDVTAAGVAEIRFRLPTYWCSANFAWIMAEDMRDAAAGVPGLSGVRVTLIDHLFAARINEAVAERAAFGVSFGAEAEDDGVNLADIRLTFRRKAFARRQLTVLEPLLARGVAYGDLAAYRLGDLRGLGTDAAILNRYLAVRPGGNHPDAPAFPDADGGWVASDAFAKHVGSARSIAINMEFNSALCRGLLAARYPAPVAA